MIRKTLLGAGALLAVFHAGVFAIQAWDGRLADPGLLLRWLLAAAIIAALVALRRQGASMFAGRRATAIWLLAALLHGPAVASRIDAVGPQALPEVVVTLVQTALTAGALGLGLGLLLGLGRLPRRAFALRAARIGAPPSAAGRLLHIAVRATGPRPPPRR